MCLGTIAIFSTLRYMILVLWICKKRFFFHHFLILNAHLWNESKLDTRNNLYSFCFGHYNQVLLIRIHDIDGLVWQEKVYFPPFPYNWNLSIKYVNFDSRNNLHSFCYWAQQSCSLHWDTRYWCFGLARKAFLSTIFLIIKVHPWNETNLYTQYNLHSFCY